MISSSVVLSVLLIPIHAFPTYWRDDNTREVRRTEVMDEVEPRAPDFFLDDDPNGLDANEIYDSIMDNPEMERNEKKFFDPVPMVNVFRSEHSPTEIGFNAPPTDIPYAHPRGRVFESIKSLKARTPAPERTPPPISRPPFSIGFFGGRAAPPPLPLNTSRSFFGEIEGSSQRHPQPPPAPLMVFTRPAIVTPLAATEAPRRAKKLFWPVWKRNTIIWVRTPPPMQTTPSGYK
ncbi:hypothetical protein PENTCL1PPCAC_27559 [Pristionchus entomophagus]|uniref:Uncharacterized protein n=1 Tax=Pristionchus entomophagus TaxID=358040 RepID=A0AAV5UH86_9BILA|nr:hypothetical protein PENTCL1PPCAC_27559 [Pristionchus entomophagus]